MIIFFKYFNNNRTKRLFTRVRKEYKEKDKKEVLRQIERTILYNFYFHTTKSQIILFIFTWDELYFML